MKIIITLSEKVVKHLRSPHTFHDECGIACSALYKLQRAIENTFGAEK